MTNGTPTNVVTGLPLWKRGAFRVGDPNQDGSITIYMSYVHTPIAVVCPQAGPPEDRRRLAAELAAGLEALDELDRIVGVVSRQAEREGGAFASWVMFELDGFRQALHVLAKGRPTTSPDGQSRRRGPNGPRGEPAFEGGAGTDDGQPAETGVDNAIHMRYR